MQKAANFLNSVERENNVVIVFNNDGDGVCSCALLLKLLEGRGVSKPLVLSQPMPVDKDLIRKLQTTVPEKIIFLDLAMDQQQDILKKAAGLCDVLIIDHHTVHKNMNSSRIVHYNPRFKSPKIYQSTSYCVYKICSEITDMKEFLWIAAVGMVSDYNLDYSKDLVDETKKKYNVSGHLYDSFIGRYADMISASNATRELSCEAMVDVFSSVEDPESPEAKNFDKMQRSYEEIRKEMSIILDDMENRLDKEGNVIFYNIQSKYSLRSPVSTKLGEMYPDKIVVVWERSGNRVKISSRHQAKNMDAGKLLERAAKGLKASAGGHDAAAGGIVDANDWEKFRERLVKLSNGEN